MGEISILIKIFYEFYKIIRLLFLKPFSSEDRYIQSQPNLSVEIRVESDFIRFIFL